MAQRRSSVPAYRWSAMSPVVHHSISWPLTRDGTCFAALTSGHLTVYSPPGTSWSSSVSDRLYFPPMAATSSREPGSAQQPPGRTRAARSAVDVWTQIQAICREAMTTGRTIATIDGESPTASLMCSQT